MKTILIPVDYSFTSSNVLKFVSSLSEDVDIERIILLKTHNVSLYSHFAYTSEYGQSNAEYILQERTEVEEQLTSTALDMLKKCKIGVKIETAMSDLPIIRAINQVVKEQKPDLLLLGSDPEGYESPIGEYVIEITQTSLVPVLIIPATSKYQKAENVLVPCDLKAVSQLALLQKLHKIQLILHPELILLNVDPERKYEENAEFYEKQLEEQLGSFSYRLFYAEEKNTAKAILDFARQNEDIQLIVALPGKHSFFYKLTHQSITEVIALNSNIPVLILKNIHV